GPITIGGQGFTLAASPGIDLAQTTTTLATQPLTISLAAGQSITLGVNQTWRLGNGATGSGQTLTINSPITGGAAAGLTFGVTNQGSGSSGTVVLNALNTYQGATQLGGPNTTYVLGTSSPFGTGNVNINS